MYKTFYSKVVETLPMNDVVFIAKLFSSNLLPGNFKDQMKSQKTSRCKATFFLDSVIEPSVTCGNGSSFDKLLIVLKDNTQQDVKELARLIESNLDTILRMRSQKATGTDKGL